MKVYKYRGIYDEELFERDLNSLQRNYYWGANFETLNDPCETIITKDILMKQCELILPIFGNQYKNKFYPVLDALESVLSQVKKIGIYSLSQTYIDELLWAHYANSHNGYCIEYELDILLESYNSDKVYSFPITYKEKPPSIDFMNIIKSSKENDLIQKMAGYKSMRWKYEEEIRIVTENEGIHSYDYKAIKGVYFGLRISENDKEEIMKRMKGRGIKYYQIEQVPNTYNFRAKNILDIYESEITYLCKVSNSQNENDIVSYKIVDKQYHKRINEKAIMVIELDSKVGRTELKSIANIIKNDIFHKATNIFISFIIKGMFEGGDYWATANFKDENLEISIIGIDMEQEKLLINGLKEESRNTIGMWLDESLYRNSSITLIDNQGTLVLETKYLNGDVLIEEFKSTQLDIGIKYDKLEGNDDCEYFIIDENGIFKYYSGNELFKELSPVSLK